MSKLIDIRITVSAPADAWKTMDDDALGAVTEAFEDLFANFEMETQDLASKYGFQTSVD